MKNIESHYMRITKISARIMHVIQTMKKNMSWITLGFQERILA
jgi:hypothetical protein